MLTTTSAFNELIKNLEKDNSSFKKVSVALLADSASQHLAKQGDYDSSLLSLFDVYDNPNKEVLTSL